MEPGYRTQSRGTSRDAEERQLTHWRAMTPAEKARVFSEMMRPTQQLARAGIESRHPGASEQEIRLRLMALRLDRETMTAREVPPRSVSKAHGRKISTLIPKKFPDARRLLGERSPELAKGVADRSSDVARRVADRRGGVLGGVADFARRLAHDSAAEARAGRRGRPPESAGPERGPR